MEEYPTFFEQATGHTPYDYQKRLACGERSESEWLNQDSPCVSRLIDIPTGLGKTPAVVMAWLWNRVILGRDDWPCRLVYCLPMRTLVEQTEDNVQSWIDRLCQASDELELSQNARSDLTWLREHSPVVLMGGEELDQFKRDWDIHPERPAVLIGTQDMLLSRALNRGYGMSRFRWPMHFAMLNNDCLWILDETQLMGSGLWTTAQLDWMRQDRFQSFKPCVSWWMSATLGGKFLETQDRSAAKIPAPEIASLSPEEESSLAILKAVRPVTIYPDPKGKTGKQDKTEFYFQRLAQSIMNEHLDGHLTLAVCNRVAHAQSLKKAIENIQTQSSSSNGNVLLLTSRFRLKDRKAALKKVVDFEEARKKGHPHPGLILVSTQVIEAGFDVSAARLWTEVAPWPSFVQRLGRLNRDGKLNGDAKAFVFEVPVQQGGIGPYDEEDLKTGKEIVSALEELCAKKPDLPARQAFIDLAKTTEFAEKISKALKPKPEPFPRASDVHGLFSTEPDVFGGFTDISPWVRNIEKTADVTVFWRKFDSDKEDPNSDEGQGLQRDELCPVSVSKLKEEFLKDSRKAWFWEPKKKRWEPMWPADLCPGMTLMLPAAYGGYETTLGWTGDPQSKIDENIPPPGPFEDREDEDRESITGNWVSLETHLSDTRNAAERISTSLNLEESESKCLLRAAELHDIGKSLDRWQGKLPCPRPKENELYAKSPDELVVEVTNLSDKAREECLERIQNDQNQTIFKAELRTVAESISLHVQIFLRPSRSTMDKLCEITGERPQIKPFRPGFRHEAASALAMWRQYYRSEASPNFPTMAIYMVAAHHGKVRTVLGANPHVTEHNVCGILIDDSTALPWNPAYTLDFEAANDGASGEFEADSTFIFKAPGWSGLVADLLGGWEKNAPKRTCGAVVENEPHSLGPFALAYFETLLRAADGRASAQPSQTLKHG